eukprot:3253996-Amphidinium_carterae.1
MARAVVDTRSFTKPTVFSGKDEEWSDWRFQFEAYIGLLGGLMLDRMEEAAAQADLPALGTLPEEQALESKNLHYMLVQLCRGKALTLLRSTQHHNGYLAWQRLVRQYQPHIATRTVGLLHAILNPRFRAQGTLEEWETDWLQWEAEVLKYEREDGALDDSIRVAIVMSRLPSVIAPQLQTQSERFVRNYTALRSTILAFLEANRHYPGMITKQPQTDTSAPMDVDAIQSKGKNSYRGKGKDKSGKGYGDYHKGNGDNQKGADGKSKKGKGKGVCWNCGGTGHKSKACPSPPSHSGKAKGKGKGKSVQAVEGHTQETAAGSGETANVGSVEAEADQWIMTMSTAAEPMADQQLLIDSGSQIHVCPRSWHEEIPIAVTKPLVVRSAGGHVLKHYGTRRIPLTMESGKVWPVTFEVADVKRPILSVHLLVKEGCSVVFAPDRCLVTHGDGTRIVMTELKGTYSLGSEVMGIDVTEPPGATPQIRTPPEPPNPPPADTVARHNMLHIPHEPWCKVCRMARIRDDPHRSIQPGRREDEENRHVQVQLDYAFGTEDTAAGVVTTTILTVRLVSSGWSGATVVSNKGATPFAVRWLVSFLKSAGPQPYRLHCDSEASIQALADAVTKEMNNGSRVIVAPTGSHSSVGVVERFHEELHAAIRAQKMQFEQRLARSLPLSCPLYSWLIRHAGWCIPRYSKHGTKTPHEHLYGIPYDGTVVNFGEFVLARDPSATEQAKHKERAYEGWWLGRSEVSGEHLVAVAQTGFVERFRTIRRRSASEQVDLNILRLGAVPWNRSAALRAQLPAEAEDTRPAVHIAPPNQIRVPGSVNRDNPPEEHPELGPAGEVAKGRVLDPAPKHGPSSMSQSRRDMRGDLGATPGCPACAMYGRWGHGRHHNRACRVRRRQWETEQNEAKRVRIQEGVPGEIGSTQQQVVMQRSTSGSSLETSDVQEPEAKRTRTESQEVPSPGTSSGVTGASSAHWLTPGSSYVTYDPADHMEEVDQVEGYTPATVQQVYCDITGQVLEEEETNEWDSQEMEKVESLGTFGEYMTIGEAQADGYKVIGTRFMRDHRKRKSRLVVQDVRRGPVDPEHWAPTPSLLVLKLTLLFAAVWGWGCTLCDVSSAFLYAWMPEELRYAVTLPRGYGRAGCCVPLRKSLYGLRVAPNLWSAHFSETMKRLGFYQSKLDASLYIRNNCLAVVHVDDLVILGTSEIRSEIVNSLREEYKLKHAEIVEKPGDRVKLLGRVLVKTSLGYQLLNDPHHVVELQDLFEMSKNTKGAMTPGEKDTDEPDDLDELPQDECHLMRKAIGKLMWLAHDRADIKHRVSKIAQDLSKPLVRTRKMTKRLVRYLIDHPVGASSLEPNLHKKNAIKLMLASEDPFQFPGGWNPDKDQGADRRSLKAYVDSDWAGDRQTRHSISGGCLFLFDCMVQAWSRKQPTVSLSSAEAELQALNTGVLEAQQLQNHVTELLSMKSGQDVQAWGVTVYTDSTAARAIALKQGLSPKVKHLNIKQLYCQEFFQAEGHDLQKVSGKFNPADLMTKAVDIKTLTRLRPMLGLTIFGGELEQKAVESIAANSRQEDAHHRLVELGSSALGRALGVSEGRGKRAVMSSVLIQSLMCVEAGTDEACPYEQSQWQCWHFAILLMLCLGMVMSFVG